MPWAMLQHSISSARASLACFDLASEEAAFSSVMKTFRDVDYPFLEFAAFAAVAFVAAEEFDSGHRASGMQLQMTLCTVALVDYWAFEELMIWKK